MIFFEKARDPDSINQSKTLNPSQINLQGHIFCPQGSPSLRDRVTIATEEKPLLCVQKVFAG